MSKIINCYPETLTKEQKYLLTKNPEVINMKDCDGQVIDIEAWAVYKDADFKTGEEREVLSILTKDGDTVSTISSTFKREFMDLVDIYTDEGEDMQKVKVFTGTSKNGRKFVSCTMAR